MVLYSHNGEYPKELPEIIRMSDGSAATAEERFVEYKLASAGYTGPFEEPEYDSKYKKLEWNGSEFVLTDVPDSDLWMSIRAERNYRLSDTDWTQARDVSLADDPAWVEYRQELRDLPSTFSDPKAVVWPQRPSENGPSSSTSF